MTQLNVGDRIGRHDLVTIHGKPTARRCRLQTGHPA